MQESKKEIKTEGHLTSIITSNQENIENDSLSQKVKVIRQKIIDLKLSDIKKTYELLLQFKDTLDENCDRIREIYTTYGSSDILIEPAIGYFIPDVDKTDALFYGAEPSSIVPAHNLSEDGLNKFFLASGIVGQKYHQQAEILKFPISKIKFNEYVDKKLAGNPDLIGTITKDQIIPTFEIVINLDELFKSNLNINLSDNYLKNLPFYVNIIMELARKQYAASTWPTNRKEFSTIYIQRWEGCSRKFNRWYTDFREFIRQYPNRITKKMARDNKMGTRKSITREDRLSGYRVRRRLIIIPQLKPNVLLGDNLLYETLIEDSKRKTLVKTLLEII